MTDEEVRALREKLEREREKRIDEVHKSVKELNDRVSQQIANEDSLLLRINAKLAEVGNEVGNTHTLAEKALTTAEGVGKSMDRRMDTLTLTVEQSAIKPEQRKAIDRFVSKEAGYDEAVSGQKKVVWLVVSSVIVAVLAMVGLK